MFKVPTFFFCPGCHLLRTRQIFYSNITILEPEFKQQRELLQSKNSNPHIEMGFVNPTAVGVQQATVQSEKSEGLITRDMFMHAELHPFFCLGPWAAGLSWRAFAALFLPFSIKCSHCYPMHKC